MESGPMLLPGQRFCPMEDELLMFYLMPKVNRMAVPGNEALIPELDLYGDQDPCKIWEIFEERKANDLRRNKDLYFFTQKKKKTARSSRASRTVEKGGTWKGQNAAKEVYLVDQNQQPTPTLLGFKKFYTYKNKGSKHHGRWIMYEFELDESQIQRKKQVNNDYVLCLLRKNDMLPEKKRRRQELEDEILEDYVDENDEDGIIDLADSVIEEPQKKRQRPDVPTSSLKAEQEQVAVSDQQEGEPLLAMDENMGLPIPPMLDAELQQLFNKEFLQPGGPPLEVEQEAKASWDVDVSGGGISDTTVSEDWSRAQMEGLINEEQRNAMEIGDWNAPCLDFGYNFAF